MSTRSFVAKHYSFSSGVRNGCKQVQLQLFEGGRFRLDALSYYKDWGDKTELRCTWEGTFSEDDAAVTCTAEFQDQVDRADDHESGLERHSCKRYADARVFRFVKSEGAVTCPFGAKELGGWFSGQPLSASEEPHEQLFGKSVKPETVGGPAPVVSVGATPKRSWE